MFDAIQIDPVAFTIPLFGGVDIFWYGIIITLGIMAGAMWAGREIEKRGQSSDELYNGLILVVFSGYFFARLTYVLFDVIGGDGYQYDSLWDVVNIRAGGVNILGGFVGALVVGTLYVRMRKLAFWHYADVAGPALLLAQAIGRWANFINQELYGQPTGSSWGLLIDEPNRLLMYRDLTAFPLDTRFHPTFLYESVMLFIGFVLLVWLNGRYRDQWNSGSLFGVFMIWWGGNRAWVELFRPDQTTIGDTFVTYSMLLSIAIALGGVYVLLLRNGKLPDRAQKKREKKRVRKPKRKTNS